VGLSSILLTSCSAEQGEEAGEGSKQGGGFPTHKGHAKAKMQAGSYEPSGSCSRHAAAAMCSVVHTPQTPRRRRGSAAVGVPRSTHALFQAISTPGQPQQTDHESMSGTHRSQECPATTLCTSTHNQQQTATPAQTAQTVNTRHICTPTTQPTTTTHNRHKGKHHLTTTCKCHSPNTSTLHTHMQSHLQLHANRTHPAPQANLYSNSTAAADKPAMLGRHPSMPRSGLAPGVFVESQQGACGTRDPC
jgi:hypothetical protein